ncbi:MAG: ASKHA domain-containing protein [Desulfomonilaceae bacterium]
MSKIIFAGHDSVIEAQKGETLLSCIRRAGLAVDSTCDGKGKCGKCRITVQGEVSSRNEIEARHLDNQAAEVRLACQARVLGNVRIALPEAWTKLKSVPGISNREVPLDSLVKRLAPTELPPGSSEPYSEIFPGRIIDLHVLQEIALLDKNEGHTPGVAFGQEILDIRFDDKPLLGAAVDLGTTNISLSVFDLESGELIGTSSALNPQTAYGGDVITRISHCRQDLQAISTLQNLAVEKIGALLQEALGPDHDKERVYLMMVAANTTMLHLLAGVYPLSLALAPFRPIFIESLIVRYDDLSVRINPQGRCILLPGISAYIGADIVAGLMAIDYRSRKGITLFIDIGTNGEIVLIEGPDRMIATSSAVGPALEGMNISCGCRAVPGAVDSFTLDNDFCPRFTTIDGIPPKGICGSGLIDLTAALLNAGLISPMGAFDPHADERLRSPLSGDCYYLADGVFLSQKDVRQVQLAKAALITGIMALLKEAGRSVDEVDEIIIAGSFGYHLNADNVKRLGMLPHNYRGPITFAGNTSLSGAALAMLNQEILREMERIPEFTRVVDLASHPDFQELFISALNFPVKGC